MYTFQKCFWIWSLNLTKLWDRWRYGRRNLRVISCITTYHQLLIQMWGNVYFSISVVKWKGINCHLAELGEVERTTGYILGPQSEKAGLKLNVQKTKIMTSSPITSWQIDGKTMETVADFIFLGSKIIADSDCSHEIKRHLLLGRKAMTNLDTMLKSRDITLPKRSI